MSYQYDWAVHFQRSVENSLDAPHVDFVHDFGAMNDTTFKLQPETSLVMVRYRERLREWEARGWRIDSAIVQRDARRVVYSIPGPGRREGGSRVLDAVPLIRNTVAPELAAPTAQRVPR